MKQLFTEFIKSFPSCKVLSNSNSAMYIYENIIWNDTFRIKFVDASDANTPALSACAKQIEDYCSNNPINDLDLSNDTVKQTIGRMVSASLSPLGYKSKSKKRLSKNLNLTYFFNATVFEYSGGETQKVQRTIVNC